MVMCILGKKYMEQLEVNINDTGIIGKNKSVIDLYRGNNGVMRVTGLELT